jgi:hypothetical protein
MRKAVRNGWRLLLPLGLVALFFAAMRLVETGRPTPERTIASPRASGPAPDDRAIAGAFARHLSGITVESEGSVERILADDSEGSRHQRFLVRLGSGQTLLVAHNIDLAPRIPIRLRDRIRFRGQYEWDERGGTVHWTHDDPQRRHPGGWIEHQGKIYR